MGVGSEGGGGVRHFYLTLPSVPIFIISLLLAVVALLAHYVGIRIPLIAAARVFDVLAVGALVRGRHGSNSPAVGRMPTDYWP